jgi:formylglycine-generating enzyme required for sulfatase activity
LLGAFVACPSDEFVRACGDEKDPYSFMMGAAGKEEPRPWEQPQHGVRVSSFHLMSDPMTRQQYGLFDPRYEHQEEDLTRYSPEPECPGIYVSWYDAWCFARWLGADYRLPTEAQWEYACRAGGDGKWCFGSDEASLGEYAWYGEDWEKGATHPVATKQPNAWGLYDMHGNVWEWCADWFDDQYYDRSPLDNPLGPATGSFRVFRGGSWNISAWFCRSAYRDCHSPSHRYNYLGFRLALVPSSTGQVGGASSGGP